MLCAKSVWYWPSGSWEEDENVKSLQTDNRGSEKLTSFQLRWVKKKRELIWAKNVWLFNTNRTSHELSLEYKYLWCTYNLQRNKYAKCLKFCLASTTGFNNVYMSVSPYTRLCILEMLELERTCTYTSIYDKHSLSVLFWQSLNFVIAMKYDQNVWSYILSTY